MARRCDRPACSELAAVAYGFDAAGRLVWLDRLLDEDRARSGALCLRHAQRLTAPKGWWLDDRRVQAPEMFRDGEPLADTPSAEPPKPRRQRRARKPRPVAEPEADPAADAASGEQLVPFADFSEDVDAADAVVLDESVVEGAEELLLVREVLVDGEVVGDEAIVLEEPEVAEPNPLLEPSSPLLARAFTGVARTDGPRRRSRRNGTAHSPAEPPD